MLQSLESYRRQEREDPLELLLAAKEAFVGGAAAAGKQGAVSIPIPQATREVSLLDAQGLHAR